MRIIDADALKRQFRKRELERSGYYINGADIYTIRKIINGTPTIEERPHGGWIPCSERLPDKEDHYLMTVISRGEIKTFVGFFIKEINDFEMFQYRYGEVLAWMPLPKPYKAGDDV